MAGLVTRAYDGGFRRVISSNRYRLDVISQADAADIDRPDKTFFVRHGGVLLYYNILAVRFHFLYGYISIVQYGCK